MRARFKGPRVIGDVDAHHVEGCKESSRLVPKIMISESNSWVIKPVMTKLRKENGAVSRVLHI